MGDFTISEMKEMQQHLQEKYKDKWEGISPEGKVLTGISYPEDR